MDFIKQNAAKAVLLATAFACSPVNAALVSMNLTPDIASPGETVVFSATTGTLGGVNNISGFTLNFNPSILEYVNGSLDWNSLTNTGSVFSTTVTESSVESVFTDWVIGDNQALFDLAFTVAAGAAPGTASNISWSFEIAPLGGAVQTLDGTTAFNVSATPVPLPGAAYLMGTALMSLLGFRWRSRKATMDMQGLTA